VPPRFSPNNDLLVRLDCDIDEHGWVVTGANGATSVPGVWVAGNVTDPRAQVITAAGEGSAAAIAINADLSTRTSAAPSAISTSRSRSRIRTC
jgi:thioredoxin reductase